MKKSLTFLVLFFSCILFSHAQEYQLTTVYLGNHTLKELAATGIDLSEGIHKKGYSFTSQFSETELDKIHSAGFQTKVGNFNHVGSRAAGSGCGSPSVPQYPMPSHFQLGSMGGYLNYVELLNTLDSMRSQYPDLISARHGIPGGTSILGDSLWYVRISDNPDTDEAEEEVLYTSLHHAREPGGMMTLVYYMYYLLENYNTDPQIHALVDNSEMYFIPCVNPDGFQYNIMTNPGGGGMWRKNRRDNADGTYGIDLNRNYGYNWGYDDFGSSPMTADETYRGTSAFSEPETQLMQSFTNAHAFRLALNYHTFGNYLIYPWGYVPDLYTPDSALFENYGQVLTRYNNYTYGTANQTVQYVTNGSSDDWMYGDSSLHQKIYSMTPEVSVGFGFWAPDTEIPSICEENVWSNLLLAKLAGPYGMVTMASSGYITSANSFLYYNFKRLGLDSAGTYTVTVTPLSAGVVSSAATKTYVQPVLLQNYPDSVSVQLAASVQSGDTLLFAVTVDNGLFTESDTISFIYGNPSVLLTENGTALTNWTGTWGIDFSDYVSAPSSISDSPQGFYQPNANTVLTYSSPVSLVNSTNAMLQFMAKWQVEPTWDYVQIEITTDNGSTWIPLCGSYTHPGGINQVPGEPLYDGFQNSWVKETILLNDYIGQTIRFRFRLVSDGASEYDGFFIDDLQILTVTPSGLNSITTPSLVSAYPVPADHQLYIQSAQLISSGKISVFNNIGMLVSAKRYQTADGIIKLDASEFAEGIYQFSISDSENKSYTGRFIVKHQ